MSDEDFLKTDEETVEIIPEIIGNEKKGKDKDKDKKIEPKQASLFSFLSLFEMSMIALFDVNDGNKPVLVKLFHTVSILKDSEIFEKLKSQLPSFSQLLLLSDLYELLEARKNKSVSKRMKTTVSFLSSIVTYTYSEIGTNNCVLFP